MRTQAGRGWVRSVIVRGCGTALAAYALSACGDDVSLVGPGPSVERAVADPDPMPVQELGVEERDEIRQRLNGVVPTMEDLSQAMEAVRVESPEVDLNSAAFRTAVVERIASAALRREQDPALRAIWLSRTTCLTNEEFSLLLANPLRYGPTKLASDQAQAEAGRHYTTAELNDGPGDAFRHAYWNALLARRTSLDWAQRFTTAHESEPYTGCHPATTPDQREHAAKARAMDLNNNAIGRYEFARWGGSKDEAWYSQRLRGLGFTYIADPRRLIGPVCVSRPGQYCTFTLAYFSAPR